MDFVYTFFMNIPVFPVQWWYIRNKKLQEGGHAMRETWWEASQVPYSLHDMNIIALEVSGEDLLLRSQSGLVKTGDPCQQLPGHIRFLEVRWDRSFVYLMSGTGNPGPFTGEKLLLKDFIVRFAPMGFSVMDESYNIGLAKYSGFLTSNRQHWNCVLEIAYRSVAIFVDETEYKGMAQVILSHDSEAVLYEVPAEAAAHLDVYCWEFAANWVWNGPENGRFLRKFGENQYGAVFGAPDFIDWLNRWEFPEQKSREIRSLGCYGYEIPPEYQHLPKYNF